jgi:uncharacterized membrane protein YesL
VFGVVRGWIRGSDTGIVRPFFERLRENFWQSLIVEVAWTPLGLGFILGLRLLGAAAPGVKVVLYPLLFLVALLYALASVFLFPVMVHFDTTWRSVLKNSLLLAIGRLPTSALCLLVVAAVAGMTFLLPVLLLISGSTTAYVVYRLCDRTFRRIARVREDHPGAER